jgi:hypothetical protein
MRRIDPEPITLLAIAAIVGPAAGVISATIASINLRRTHFKEAPSIVRRKILEHVENLEKDVGALSGFLKTIEDILQRGKFPGGKRVELGNGALVTLADFKRYQLAWDEVMKRLRAISKRTLKIELLTAHVGFLDKRVVANKAGKGIDAFRQVLESRGLPVTRAFQQLKLGLDGTTELTIELRRQLDELKQP